MTTLKILIFILYFQLDFLQYFVDLDEHFSDTQDLDDTHLVQCVFFQCSWICSKLTIYNVCVSRAIYKLTYDSDLLTVTILEFVLKTKI